MTSSALRNAYEEERVHGFTTLTPLTLTKVVVRNSVATGLDLDDVGIVVEIIGYCIEQIRSQGLDDWTNDLWSGLLDVLRVLNHKGAEAADERLEALALASRAGLLGLSPESTI